MFVNSFMKFYNSVERKSQTEKSANFMVVPISWSEVLCHTLVTPSLPLVTPCHNLQYPLPPPWVWRNMWMAPSVFTSGDHSGKYFHVPKSSSLASDSVVKTVSVCGMFHHHKHLQNTFNTPSTVRTFYSKYYTRCARWCHHPVNSEIYLWFGGKLENLLQSNLIQSYLDLCKHYFETSANASKTTTTSSTCLRILAEMCYSYQWLNCTYYLRWFGSYFASQPLGMGWAHQPWFAAAAMLFIQTVYAASLWYRSVWTSGGKLQLDFVLCKIDYLRNIHSLKNTENG